MGSEVNRAYRTLRECTSTGSVSYGIVQPGKHVEDGVPIVRVNNINDGTLDVADPLKVDPTIDEKHRKTRLEGGEVLLSLVGTTGQCVVAGPELKGWNVARAIAVIKPAEGIDADWLTICLKSPETQHYLDSRANTTVQKTLNLSDVREIPILTVPDVEESYILKWWNTLNDKIELNRRMNATLEAMAQALFKSWFVDFDPVIDNALAAGNPIPDELATRAEVRKNALESNQTSLSAEAPAKAGFPAAFEFNDELGWIPEGWTLQSFESLATLDTESVKPFEQPSTVWEHYSIPSFDSSGMPSWDRGDEIKSNKYRVKPGAILSSKLNPETERTWWPFLLDGETAICSTEFMQFVPTNLDEQAFVYSLIRSAPFQANILERVTGSTGSRQRAQPKEIAKIGVLDCRNTLRAEFAKVALPLFQSVRNNYLRTQTLTKLRDSLLPKLISGGIEIPIPSIVKK